MPRTRTSKTTLALSLGMILLGASVASAIVESSCPAPCTKLPKEALSLRERNGTTSGTGAVTPLTGTLAKGKSKTLLRIDASFSGTTPVPTLASLLVYVNGVLLQDGIAFGAYADQCLPTICTLTGTFWLDIDAAEAANPGLFMNQPLVISLDGGNGQAAQSYSTSLSAQLLKKK
jgi:hypothetical protein